MKLKGEIMADKEDQYESNEAKGSELWQNLRVGGKLYNPNTLK